MYAFITILLYKWNRKCEECNPISVDEKEIKSNYSF